MVLALMTLSWTEQLNTDQAAQRHPLTFCSPPYSALPNNQKWDTAVEKRHSDTRVPLRPQKKGPLACRGDCIFDVTAQSYCQEDHGGGHTPLFISDSYLITGSP